MESMLPSDKDTAPEKFVVPSQYWIENTPAGKEDDIRSLGVLLHEMATLSSSLSLIHRIDSKVARPPVPTFYTHAFSKFLSWLSQPNTPTMFQIINDPYFYRFYYSAGVKLARSSRNKHLKDCK
jgi:hypothetical protein